MLDKSLWLFIEISNACIEILLIFSFIKGFIKNERLWPYIKTIPFGVVCGCVSFFTAYFFSENTFVILACSLTLAFVTAKLAYEATVKTAVTAAVFYVIFGAISELLSAAFVTIIQGAEFGDLTEFSSARFQVLIIKNILFFILVKIITRIRKQSMSQLSAKLWFLLMLAPCISLLVVVDMTLMLIKDPGNHPALTVFSIIGLFLLNFLVFNLIENVLRGAEAQKRLQISEIMLETQKQRILDFAVSQTKLRQITHDMKQHAICIQALSAANNNEELDNYIKSFIHDIPGIKTYYDTGNPALDAVLSNKREIAERNGIECDWRITLQSEMPLQRTELCVLAGNALDNAIEACCRTDGGRRISLTMMVSGSNLLIEIENTLDKPPVKDGDSFMTSKPDLERHGLGLESMKSCVKRMGGSLSVDFDDKHFLTRLLLPFGK